MEEKSMDRNEIISDIIITFENRNIEAYNKYFERVFDDCGYYEKEIAEIDPIKADLVKALFQKHMSDIDVLREDFVKDVKGILLSIKTE
jgi:hypothetical protein